MEFLRRVAYSVVMACISYFLSLEVSEPCGTIEGSHDSEVYRRGEQTLDVDAVSSESMVESPESVRNVEQRRTAERIEHSKRHWSQLSSKVKLGSTEEDGGDSMELGSIDEEELERVAADNREVFKTLRLHPIWGRFFWTTDSFAEFEVKEKFAEGGQAELFHARVKVQWHNDWNEEHGVEFVLKVFKKGTLLCHLQSQWPQGMLQFLGDQIENWESSTPKNHPRFFCSVQCGTLLEDGRFAFLLKRELEDLWSVIDKKMTLTLGRDCGPFSKDDAEEIMFNIALGVAWLHSHNIIHRDLKASNVLIDVLKDGRYQCFVADYECSIGVVGTGFFRAPEILEACKDRSISERPELFTEASDVYSYAMTCYEILTGQLPFDGHPSNDYDLVLSGMQPEVPKYVDTWICELLSKCWQVDCEARLSFEEILNLILSNSMYIRKLVGVGDIGLEELEWVKWKQ